MTKNRFLYFLCAYFVFSNCSSAQNEEKIRFKKEQGFVYFFQKGQYRDTLQKNQGDVFYLIVPDSLKPYLSIQVDNAQLLKTENDSLVSVNYVKGFNYESLYIAIEPAAKTKTKQKAFEFKTLVNGVSMVQTNRIEIKFLDKREKSVLLKNTFYMSSKK